MKRIVSTFALLLLAVSLPALAAHHANGTWELAVTLGDGQGGTATITLEETEAGTLTGTYTGALGEAEVSGTVDGDAVEFSFDSQAGKISYRGTVDGDSMEGTCTYGQLGEGTFEGSRNQE